MSDSWKCSHGHTKEEHPACYREHKKSLESNTTLKAYVEEQSKKPENAKPGKTFESKGVGHMTKSGKMVRLEIFGFQPSPIFLYAYVLDIERHLDDKRRNFTLYKLLTFKPSEP